MRSILLVLTVFAAPILSQEAASQATYSRSIEIPALRISYLDLQTVLDRATSLMDSANSGSKFSIWREEVELREGSLKIKLPGHRLSSTGARLPKQVDEFSYSIDMRNAVA